MIKEKSQTILKEKRSLALKQMKEQNEELNQLEQEILITGLKTQTIKEQNDIFLHAIQDIQTEFELLGNEKQDAEMDQDRLEKEYNRLNRKILFSFINPIRNA